MGRIWFGKKGNSQPGVIRYLSEDEGLVPWTWWSHEEVGHNDESKKEQLDLHPDEEAFDTPKPERLMHRIIHIATNPGDVVLDCFGGSGTTAAVAHKLGRRWITAELSHKNVETYLVPRLERVVSGEDVGGVSYDTQWEGGGGFRVLDIAGSMYEDDEGVIVLADSAHNGTLAEQVAAQLGFDYRPEPPFSGKHGRTRLAVIDGHVDESVVQLLVRALETGERLSLVGTSLDPEVHEVLSKLRSGSVARVVPQDTLLAYRSSSWWRGTRATKAVAPDADSLEVGALPDEPAPKAAEATSEAA
jgi:adenine-specific DNA-methyltransferase